MTGRYVFKKPYFRFLATGLDVLGYSAKKLGFFGGSSVPSLMESPKHILLVRLDHLGDALLVSGVPRLLKNKYPLARITILSSGMGSTIFQQNPFVNEILVYNTRWFRRKRDERTAHIDFRTVFAQLLDSKIDLVLAPRGDLRENRFLYQLKIPHRIGYGITGGGFFLNHELPYRFGVHEAEHTKDLLKKIGISTDALMPEIFFSKQEEEKFSEKFSEWGFDPKLPSVGFQVNSGSPAKDWPLTHFHDFLEMFRQSSLNQRLVVVGQDRSIALGPSDERVLDLRGKTSLREMLYVIKHVSTFVGPDSGPTHVAASFGKPTLFLHSGTNRFEEWKSLSPTASFLRQEVPCSPCHETTCFVQGHPCMAQIKPQAVLDWLS